MNYNKHDLDSYSELMEEMLNSAAVSRAEEDAKENVNNGTAVPVEVATVNSSGDSASSNDGNNEGVDLDPEPASPLDAYGCFYRDTLDMYMKKYPDMPFLDVLNQQSSDWNSMSAEEKEKWELVSKKEKKQFLIDFQAWQERK
ncbi:hypothetical protein JH06_4304 [Blastocystis sp. subtype 4]|uniref:hypothetical protein n=1 Tax=Blastocystis sp. subtype 4 TaxID=944170 RepID=UPI000711347B|nr:hypothetical protein JH06_4304 [Blastocystis sp. subtype 4]KNB45122.1 hypothetical protein JH06_4304 [Blastocystis sp. subtype 4]|eukprot:XP_014528580.1 hypothetical protein JH06_4304 [Blastocystis sp. subtype 4]